MSDIINESPNEKEILDLMDFIIPDLKIIEPKQAFRRRKNNEIYFVDSDSLQYFQYNVLTKELGYNHQILMNALKYMPGIKVILIKFIREWFSKKYDLPVLGIPFPMKISFVVE